MYKKSDSNIFFLVLLILINNTVMALNINKLNTTEENRSYDFGNYDYRHSIACDNENQWQSDDSIRIIETRSEPDVFFIRDTEDSLDFESKLNSSYSFDDDCTFNSTDDSFLRIEKMVTDQCMSPSKNNGELDNTLEVVEYILNNASLNNNGNHNTEVSFKKVEVRENNYNFIPMTSTESPLKITYATEPKDDEDKLQNKNVESKSMTKLTTIESLDVTPVKNCITETKNIQNLKTDVRTPQEEKKHSEAIFKTPENMFSSKMYPMSSSKKTGKFNKYQHITSPVASYIKNSPQVTLIRDVHPKKPLPGSAAIPKLVKSTSDLKICNKESVMLPSVAYKSAKQTIMVTVPDKKKLPQSPWAQKVASALPKPLVIKHDHREISSKKGILGSQQEDSFADLSLHQADLSVCTQKSAFSKPV